MRGKFIYFTLFLLFAGYCSYSQNDSLKSNYSIINKLYITAGGIYTDFQDTKFSDLRYSGPGVQLELGFDNYKKAKHYQNVKFSFEFSKEKANSLEISKTTVLDYNLSYKYLWSINNLFLLGAKADILGFNMRSNPNLGNNNLASIMSNHLYFSAMYINENIINEDWCLSINSDLSLISIQDEVPSFGVAYSNGMVENGDVSFDSHDSQLPSYTKGSFHGIWDNFRIFIDFNMNYKKRFVFSYSWQMRRYSSVENYPTTIGVHALKVRFNIANWSK